MPMGAVVRIIACIVNKKGEFTQDFTMSQMIEFCLQFLDQWAVQTECKLSPVQAKEQMLQHFPT